MASDCRKPGGANACHHPPDGCSTCRYGDLAKAERVARVSISATPRPAASRPDVVEAAKALLTQFDSYQDSDLNYECAHRYLVRYELWEALRAALCPDTTAAPSLTETKT